MDYGGVELAGFGKIDDICRVIDSMLMVPDYIAVMKRAVAAIALALLGTVAAAATTFAILTDVHVSPGNDNEAWLRRAVAEINAGPAQAVLVTGDLTNEGRDEELLNVKSVLDGLAKPAYYIPGNHENNWSESACTTFVKLWGSDRFAFELDSLFIVAMNCGPYMKMGDGHVRSDDLAWLDSVLSANRKPIVISVNHYPLADDLDRWEAYTAILHRYPVAVHLNGHYHVYKQYRAGDIDGLMSRALSVPEQGHGYTLISIDHGTLYQYEKLIDEPERLVTSLPLRLSHPPYIATTTAEQPVPEGYDIKLMWRDEASVFTRLAVDSDRLYFGTSAGLVKAIDTAEGGERWRVATAGPLFSRPVVAGDAVIVPTSDGRLLWLSRTDGSVKFSKAFPHAFVADGLISDDILLQGGYKTVTAWEPRTATLLWRDTVGNYCQGAPAVASGRAVIGCWDTFLRCYDLATGRELWRWSNGKSNRLFSPGNVVPHIAGRHVIIVAPDRYMTCIDLTDGHTIWRDNSYTVREAMGASADGRTVYAKTMDGKVIAVDATADTFTLRWATDAGFGYEHAPCPLLESRGTVYAGSRKGVVAALDAATGALRWSYRLGCSEVNGFETDAHGNIYAVLTEGTIWRITPPQE